MKQVVRYLNLLIPSKLRVETRITVDDSSNRLIESVFERDADKFTNITLYPIVSISLIKPTEIDEDGRRVRSTWNPNDNLGLTKFSLPVFINELVGIQKDMSIPELYSYRGTRLELNEEIASKIRRVFMVGQTTLELSAVVIVTVEENRVEGIKMKFNNENSSVLLTLNELAALSYTLQHMDLDSLSMLMYLNFCQRGITYTNRSQSPEVDIIPK